MRFLVYKKIIYILIQMVVPEGSVCVSCSVLSDSATPWTVAHQASLSMGFSWQEYWSGLPFPSPEDLPDPGIESWSPALQADYLSFEIQASPFRRIFLCKNSLRSTCYLGILCVLYLNKNIYRKILLENMQRELKYTATMVCKVGSTGKMI